MSSLEKRAAVVPPRGGGGAAVAPPTVPPPRPRFPPAYPDLYGRRREASRVQMLEREIGFLETELKFIEGIQPASKYCKEVSDLVVANSDPLVPVQKKSRRPCRFWKCLCSGIPCLNLLSFFCCCQSECSGHLRRPECCSQRNCSCPSFPSDSDCCPKPSCGSCSRGCSCGSCSDTNFYSCCCDCRNLCSNPCCLFF